MKITVQVEIYSHGSKETVDVELTAEDLRRLAEARAEQEYTFKNCQAKGIKYVSEIAA